jgi:hypothetical protein
MTNHEDETATLPRLLVEVAPSQIHVHGLSLEGGTATTFVEFKRIYGEAVLRVAHMSNSLSDLIGRHQPDSILSVAIAMLQTSQ